MAILVLHVMFIGKKVDYSKIKQDDTMVLNIFK